MRDNQKKFIDIENVIGAEDTLMHKVERLSNYFFTHNQAEQMKKGVICVKIC